MPYIERTADFWVLRPLVACYLICVIFDQVAGTTAKCDPIRPRPSVRSSLVRIDRFPLKYPAQYVVMKVSEKKVLSIRCPTCGAKPGEKCELSTGLPRTDPHRDRRLAASDK